MSGAARCAARLETSVRRIAEAPFHRVGLRVILSSFAHPSGRLDQLETRIASGLLGNVRPGKPAPVDTRAKPPQFPTVVLPPLRTKFNERPAGPDEFPFEFGVL